MADKERLFAFLREAYADQADYVLPKRWEWLFEQNPFLRGHDVVRDHGDALPIFIAELGGEIVGQICALPAPLQVGDERVDSIWGTDLVVLPKARGKGVGMGVVSALVDHYGVYLAIEMADSSRHIHERLGSFEMAPVPTWVRVVRTRPDDVRRYLLARTRRVPRLHGLVQFACRWLFAAHLIAWLLSGALAIRRIGGSVRSRSDGSVAVESVEAFPPEVDALWQAGRGRVGLPRERTYLEWRSQGDGRLTYARFLARREGRVTGTLILRRPDPAELAVGIVLDLQSSPEDEATLEALLDQAEAFFGRDVAAIETATSLPHVGDALSRRGFRVRKETAPTCVCTDPELAERLRGLSECWHLTKADQDWDQLHPA